MAGVERVSMIAGGVNWELGEGESSAVGMDVSSSMPLSIPPPATPIKEGEASPRRSSTSEE